MKKVLKIFLQKHGIPFPEKVYKKGNEIKILFLIKNIWKVLSFSSSKIQISKGVRV